MTDYITGQWYGWNGGECPVHPETVVEVEIGYRDEGLARHYIWNCEEDNPIIAFRVVTPYVEPKLERWINVYDTWVSIGYSSEQIADAADVGGRIRCVRMTEPDD